MSSTGPTFRTPADVRAIPNEQWALVNESRRTSRLTAPILTYAARYALGRRTSAPHDVEEAIAANLDAFRRDHGCREALIEDITRARDGADDGALGDPVDREAWLRTLGRLESAR